DQPRGAGRGAPPDNRRSQQPGRAGKGNRRNRGGAGALLGSFGALAASARGGSPADGTAQAVGGGVSSRTIKDRPCRSVSGRARPAPPPPSGTHAPPPPDPPPQSPAI